jgi:undecaprenyl diphosphate synthase
VDALMSLLIDTIDKELGELMENNVSLHVIGDIISLPLSLQKKLSAAIKRTGNNTGLNLVLALSYSGRWELLNAIRGMAEDVKNDKLKVEDIECDVFSRYLTTKNLPDPELLIRTSGEYRISNFLLWQIAYAELYFTDTLWPDFRKAHFFDAIVDFQKRERRFGKISEQIKSDSDK